MRFPLTFPTMPRTTESAFVGTESRVLPQTGTPRARERAGLGLLTVACLLFGLAPMSRAQCVGLSIDASRWCSPLDINFYWAEGLNACGTSTQCTAFQGAIRAAVLEFNLTAVSELTAPIFLLEAGPIGPSDPQPARGIVFALLAATPLSCADTTATTQEMIGATHTFYAEQTGSPLLAIGGANVGFNASVPWGNNQAGRFDRKTAALHELLHALGVGHASGDCLMATTVSCGQTHDLDGDALLALQCLYGDPNGGCFPMIGIFIEASVDGAVTTYFGQCDCSGGGCMPKVAHASSPAAFDYEFAVSESGGPYTVFALLQESNLLDHRYTHQFTQAYSSALIRLRVLSGADVVDEAFARTPIAIQPTSTAGPPALQPQQPLRVLTAPNPFTGQTAISFKLAVEQSVELAVYDVAGRRVATLHDGLLGAGEHRIVWDGRTSAGGPAASGIYHCVVRVAGVIASSTLAKVR
jgi:hypothetical protein